MVEPSTGDENAQPDSRKKHQNNLACKGGDCSPDDVGASFSSSLLAGHQAFKTVGALDLGGASAQITFIPERDVLQNVFNLRVRNTNIRLYTHSFLHYGRNEAENRVAADIISDYLENDVGSTTEIVHPCYPTGTRM